VNLKDLLNRDRVLRFMRFVTVGASVAVIDCSGVALFSRVFPPLVAVTVAYFIAVCCHYLANKFWVFRCRRSDYLKQLFSYGVVIVNNWLITMIVVSVCLATFTSNVVIAKLCAIPCATMCNFLLMQLVVFRPHRSTKEVGRPEDEIERLPYAQVETE
jgi:putative flippase GtrA